LRIFSQHTNLSNEKALIQQFNALNHELDLLKIQLNKVNQLLNDTIVEKCKQELNFQSIEAQQQHQQQKPINQDLQFNKQQQIHEPILNPNLNPMQQYKIKTYFDSHSNINESTNQTKSDNNNSLLNNTSIWKQPTPQKQQQQQQYYFTSLVDTNKTNDQQPQSQYFSNNHRANVANNDKIREKRRASIGKVPLNFNMQSTQNENKPSAMERLFGSQKNLDQLNAIKKIAMVKPEMRSEDTAYV
jgi:hypothetical protein